MDYPVYKRTHYEDNMEYDKIVSEDTVVSVRIGQVKSFGTITRRSVVERILSDKDETYYLDSTEEEFMKAIKVVMDNEAVKDLMEIFKNKVP